MLVFTGKEGQSRDEYRWSEDGTEIKLEVTVSSPHLPVPLIYLLDYRRKLTPPQEHAPSAPERRSVESGPGKPISEKMSP